MAKATTGWPIGQRVTALRAMTNAEREAQGWENDRGGIVIELDDGTLLYPSQDEEGNGPGELFGRDPDGKDVVLFPPRRV